MPRSSSWKRELLFVFKFWMNEELSGMQQGKSTLLMSLLGETNKISGYVFLPSPIVRDTAVDPGLQLTESTAYCPQVPWLLSASIRENILFGSPMYACLPCRRTSSRQFS
jgi:ABC-type branched-subunit amino acid transport system ATPase component